MSNLYPGYVLNPHLADLTPEAVDLLCAIILAHPAAADLRAGGWSDREYIDAFLNLQASGFVRILWDKDADRFTIQLAPFEETLQ